MQVVWLFQDLQEITVTVKIYPVKSGSVMSPHIPVVLRRVYGGLRHHGLIPPLYCHQMNNTVHP